MSRAIWRLIQATLVAVLLAASGEALRAAEGEPFVVGAFRFTPPVGWQVAPSSGMRKAELRIPDPLGGEQGVCSFFHFGPGQGGTPAANIERWQDQFQEPPQKLAAKIGVEDIAGTRVHWFRASGTFLSGMPGQATEPKPGTTLLAAVLESTQGHVFVRCVAPTRLADASEPAFRALIQSPLQR